LLKREKGNITLHHVPGLALAFSHFRGLSAAMLNGLARSRDPRFIKLRGAFELSRIIPDLLYG